MFCALTVCFIFLGGLQAFVNSITEKIDSKGDSVAIYLKAVPYILSALISLVLSLSNTFLSTLSEKLVFWERHMSSTNHFKSHL